MTALFTATGGILNLFILSIFWCKEAIWNLDKIFYQITEIGNNTLPVATLIALSSGAVISLQSGPTLVSFGIEENLGGLVGLSMVKEIGPIMASILIAGRVGSAMTAEIGSMSVYIKNNEYKPGSIPRNAEVYCNNSHIACFSFIYGCCWLVRRCCRSID